MLRKLFTTLTAAIATLAIALPAQAGVDTPNIHRLNDAIHSDATPEERAERIERELHISRSSLRSNVVDTYKVKSGDTLAEIAETHDIKGGYVALWGANLKKIDHPDLLTAGQVLTLDSAPAKGKKALAKLPAPVTTTGVPSSGTSTASSYGSGACGGDLPTCEIMMCESGGDIRIENQQGSSASGKWQIIDGTWNGYGGYARAKDAPEHVQDAKARELWAGGAGRSQWEC